MASVAVLREAARMVAVLPYAQRYVSVMPPTSVTRLSHVRNACRSANECSLPIACAPRYEPLRERCYRRGASRQREV